MKVAVAYDNGEVGQHFGHAESFKVYEIEDKKIINTSIVDVKESGHDAVASLIKSLGCEAVICGGMGQEAYDALMALEIEAVTGVAGEADYIVDLYMSGAFKSEGANCGCGGNCGSEGGCGGGCAGCSGCGGSAPMFEGPNVGKICKVHYRGTFNDGEVFDSSFERGEPIQFVCGMGMMIKGFDKAVATMNVGDKVNVHLMPEEAYGPVNPNYVIEAKIAELPGSEDLKIGDQVVLSNSYGQQFPVKVTAKTEEMITLDANHEMAGKELNFEIELVSVSEDE